MRKIIRKSLDSESSNGSQRPILPTLNFFHPIFAKFWATYTNQADRSKLLTVLPPNASQRFSRVAVLKWVYEDLRALQIKAKK